MQLKHVAKSMLKQADLLSQTSKGFTSIEVHLRPEEVTQSIEKKLELAEKTEATIVNVHTPLRKECPLYLDDLLNPDYYKEIAFACRVAQEFAMRQGNRVNVIIHVRSSLTELKATNKYHCIVGILCRLFALYPLVNISLENSMLLSLCNGRPRLCNASFAEPVQLVHALRESCCNSNIYAVFDVCHMLSSMRVNQECFEPYGASSYSFADMLEQYKDTTNIIHVANAHGYGMGAKFHGTPFQKDEPQDVLLLTQLLETFGDRPYYVYEVREDDYSNTVNVVTTHDALMYALHIISKEE